MVCPVDSAVCSSYGPSPGHPPPPNHPLPPQHQRGAVLQQLLLAVQLAELQLLLGLVLLVLRPLL